jgi:N-sulfoglucosamine sulfohydrolase
MMMKQYMNTFKSSVGLAALVGFSPLCKAAEKPAKPLNLLLIVADDLNFSSVGYMGATVDAITPNLDKLARQGLIFANAHVTAAVSQPSRGALMTGLYPHHSGVEGFFHTSKDIPTLMSVLRNSGYAVGIAGKVSHSTPVGDFKWDREAEPNDLGQGRNPERYYQEFTEFVKTAKESGKPFYFMANSHDPHRPFHGSEGDIKMKGNGKYPDPSRVYRPEEITVPGFLPDIPLVREELAQYFSSVRRLDDMVGKVLQVLDEQGIADNTVVMFLSDNGISQPFAKTNCYMNSTHTPWIVRWNGVVAAGSNDSEHFISGIDFMPTALEICGVKTPQRLDGRSFLPLLKGKTQKGRDRVYTQFYETSGKNRYPMFAVQTTKHLYIFNPWSDGSYLFKNEAQVGLAFKGMREAGSSNPDIQQRVNLLWYRTPEEFYDLEKDPDALVNLVDNTAYAPFVETYRHDLEKWMKIYGSTALEAFQNRDKPEIVKKYVADQIKQSKEPKQLNRNKQNRQ